MRDFEIGDEVWFSQRNDEGTVVRHIRGFISGKVKRPFDPMRYDFVLEGIGMQGSFFYTFNGYPVIISLQPFLKWELADADEISGEEANNG